MSGEADDSATCMPCEIVRGETADLETLSRVIAAAFHDLPPSRWLIADPKARQAVFPGYFQIYVHYALNHGIVYTTRERTATALWLPIGIHGPTPIPDYDVRLAAATHPWTSRFQVFDAALERHHPCGPPHHHLVILAVRPDHQGKGIGSALLNAHHATLDRDGLTAYLEAANLDTRGIYLRRGYADHERPIRLPDGPALYPMVRDPREGADRT
jgi:GNAT superfamily N-acetyltransferase